jgi:peroxiredoxin
MRLLTTVLLTAAIAAPAGALAYEIGDTVADFTLTDLSGAEVSLYDHFGEIILLNFFATWCPGCNDEADALQHQIWEVYQDRGVSVIALNMLESQALVEGWAQDMGVDYHIWLAPDWTIFQQFPQAGGIPYNAVLDREMTLRYAELGFALSELIGMIETILDEDAVAADSATWSEVKAAFR